MKYELPEGIIEEDGKFFQIGESGKREEVEFFPGRGWYTEEERIREGKLGVHCSF